MIEALVILFTGAFLFMQLVSAFVTAPCVLESNGIDILDEPLYIFLRKMKFFAYIDHKAAEGGTIDGRKDRKDNCRYECGPAA
jgi:hypothetical protein